MKNVKKLLVTLLFIVCMAFSIINITPTLPDNFSDAIPEPTTETDGTTNEIIPLHDNPPLNGNG